MKNQFILWILLIQLSGCEVFRPSNKPADNLSVTNKNPPSGTSQPQFIPNISTEESVNSTVSTPSVPLFGPDKPKSSEPSNSSVDIHQLQFKYAILTNTPVEELTNPKLLRFMDQWYGVHYQYGGSTMEGIDCSAFASLLMADVYNVRKMPRISADQYMVSRRIAKKNLREGDLVFFHTLGKGHRVTHVGIYLYNNRFIHASIAGVQINDLSEGYYLQHYVGAGRVIEE